MKTLLLTATNTIKAVAIAIAITFSLSASSQLISTGSLTNGLNFDNPQRVSASDLVVGSEYLFSNVVTGVNAKVTIDSLVNGATVSKIDDNSNGIGYKSAFQPAIKSGGTAGKSYAVFTISFINSATAAPAILSSVSATPIDLDGNSNLKEFAQIKMGTGFSTGYMMASPDILVESILSLETMGRNILGIERNGIDTSSLANMFTVTNTSISSFTIKYGTITNNNNSSVRQYSLYMKGFNYSLPTLPVKLLSFNAILNTSSKVDLNWKTTAEVNLNYFTVERSLDGVNFNDAGMVFAAGNASSEIAYKLTDNVAGISSPVVYYRLRSVDNDGKSQLSETRLIRLGKQGSETLSVLTYPNPATSELRITIPAAWQNKTVVYEIFGLNGQLVNKSISATAGQTEIKSISSLQSGMYNLRVSCDGQIATQKIVKQ